MGDLFPRESSLPRNRASTRVHATCKMVCPNLFRFVRSVTTFKRAMDYVLGPTARLDPCLSQFTVDHLASAAFGPEISCPGVVTYLRDTCNLRQLRYFATPYVVYCDQCDALSAVFLLVLFAAFPASRVILVSPVPALYWRLMDLVCALKPRLEQGIGVDLASTESFVNLCTIQGDRHAAAALMPTSGPFICMEGGLDICGYCGS
jgi:hypothetical protein